MWRSAATSPSTAGVTAIPVTAFYEGAAPNHYARFAFCKRPEVLDAAIARLAAHFAAARRGPVDGPGGIGVDRASTGMAGVAQMVERQVVVLDVTGSSPVARPIPCFLRRRDVILTEGPGRCR